MPFPPATPVMPPRILARKRLPDEARRGACARNVTRAAPPLAIAPSRCNRCGACLGLGCPAISDVGGEALVIDPALCAGGRICAPLCRARAIAPVELLAPGQPRPAAPPLA